MSFVVVVLADVGKVLLIFRTINYQNYYLENDVLNLISETILYINFIFKLADCCYIRPLLRSNNRKQQLLYCYVALLQ